MYKRQAYGRCDFQFAGYPDRLVQLYTYYYMRRSYCAARAFYELVGGWLFPAVRNVSARVVFCDLAYEGGASGLAFADVCKRLPHIDLAYLGVCPVEEMLDIARLMFRSDAYRQVQTNFYTQAEKVPPAFWKMHAKVSELIVFNVSNLFDRITPGKACGWAEYLNRLIADYPLNHYAVFYRDDTGERANRHSYDVFCAHLSPAFAMLNERMPLNGDFYYNRHAEGVPVSESFIYEVRTT